MEISGVAIFLIWYWVFLRPYLEGGYKCEAVMCNPELERRNLDLDKAAEAERLQNKRDFRRFLLELVKGNVNVEWISDHGRVYFRGRVLRMKGSLDYTEYVLHIWKVRISLPFKET